MSDLEANTVKVRCSRELLERLFTRDHLGRRLRVEWGEPNFDGCHTPTISVYDQAEDPRGALFQRVAAELDRAYAKHGDAPWGRHEFYGILAEEFRELEAAIFGDELQERVLDELVQVAAMCFRYLETGDRYRGEHPRSSMP